MAGAEYVSMGVMASFFVSGSSPCSDLCMHVCGSSPCSDLCMYVCQGSKLTLASSPNAG